MELEEWKDIPGYEGLYQVSSFGNVKSFNYMNKGTTKILKTTTDKKGYLNTYLTKDKKTRRYRIHQLVAMAFHNHIPDGTMKIVVNHIDNNKLNNRKDNINLKTNRDNSSCHKTNPGVKLVPKGRKKIHQVQITINNVNITIGYYYTLEEANRMYQLASQNFHLYDGDNSKFRQLIKTGSDV